jgi:hypothetical protein
MATALRLQITATSSDILDPATAMIGTIQPLNVYTRKRAMGQNILTGGDEWEVGFQGAQTVSYVIIKTDTPVSVTLVPLNGDPATVPVSELLVISSRVNPFVAITIEQAIEVDANVTAILFEQADASSVGPGPGPA